jgi:CRISPR-associated protein Csh1
VLENGDEIILSTHKDYLEVVKRDNNLDTIKDEKNNSERETRFCYICKKKKYDVSGKYTTKFKGESINKIFITTTVNSSQYFKDYEHTFSNYHMCKGCYQKLLSGGNIISKEFRSKIAKEDVFIIPKALNENFDYNKLNILKNDVDLAFKSDNAEEWLKTIDMEKDIENIGLYTVSFIFYRTDGNSITILEAMEDVPTIRFKRVMKILSYYTELLKPYTKNVSLGVIYRLVPVKSNKKGEQIDIGRVLSLYKTLLCGESISTSVLYSYAVEALEKGLMQLKKSKIDNYINMGIDKYKGYEDFFIKRIIFGYIVLLKTFQKLNILNQKVFKEYKKEGEKLYSINTPSQEINFSIMKIEEFIEKQGFSNDEKALFYLGVLVNRVAVAQYQKEHKTKPILNKIQFQGMNVKDIYRLYEDTIERLKQYNKMTLFTEAVMSCFHYYFGTLDKKWNLNDQANVFYIMSGYSYMVGNKSPDLTTEELETLNEKTDEDNDNLN